MQSLKESIKHALTATTNVFDTVLDTVRISYEEPCHQVGEFKRRSTTAKGGMFESLCVIYLRSLQWHESLSLSIASSRGSDEGGDIESFFAHVWALKEVPLEHLKVLGLKRQDKGIDLIALGRAGGYYAFQCKYRKPTSKKPKSSVTWKQLSTFYALCAKTGPWASYVVMTNCNYVSREGHKDEKDFTVGLDGFRAIHRDTWRRMYGYDSTQTDGKKCGSSDGGGVKLVSTDVMKLKRLAHLEALLQKQKEEKKK